MKPYYSDDYVQLFLGDCREILPHVSWDAMVCDPPYGVDLGFHAGASENRAGYLVKAGYSSYDDSPARFESEIVPAITEAIGQSKRALVFAAGHNAWLLPRPSALGGVYVPAGLGRHRWGFNCFHVALLYGSMPGLEKGARPSVMRSNAGAEANGHPCPKPIEWMTWAVDYASATSDTVLDPFAGSGTTLRAAKDLGRKAIGIEICEKYCEIAARRCSQEVLDLTT